MVKIEVNLSSRLFYTLVAILCLVIGGLGVFAVSSQSHPLSEIEIPDNSILLSKISISDSSIPVVKINWAQPIAASISAAGFCFGSDCKTSWSQVAVPLQNIKEVGGSVGIGTTTPTAKLEVAGNIKGNALCIGADCKTAWSQVGQVFTQIKEVNNNIGIGTTTPSQKLEVAGNIKASGVCINNDCRTAWPAYASAEATNSVSTTLGSAVDLPQMAVTITTSGRPVFISFSAAIARTSYPGQNSMHGFIINIDGNDIPSTLRSENSNYISTTSTSITHLAQLSAGQHTIKVKYWSLIAGWDPVVNHRNLIAFEI